MADTRARAGTGAAGTKRVEKRAAQGSREIRSAVAQMRAILDELEEYSGVYEETTALRGQLEWIDQICADRFPQPCEQAGEAGADPRAAAKELVERIELEEIFQDKALSEAFLAELFLAVAQASGRESRREYQRKGIDAAKARGVRFGRAAQPLPEGFERARRAWREGELSLRDAAKQCGMATSSFYDAVQRTESAVAAQPSRKASAPVGRRRPAEPIDQVSSG